MPIENAKPYIKAHHWEVRTSTYGTGDQLLGLLRANWEIIHIERVTRLHKGRRFTTFSFELARNEQMTVMLVVYTPFIQRLVNQRTQQSVWKEQGIQYEAADERIEVVTMKPLAALI
jgi:hypothetical protein